MKYIQKSKAIHTAQAFAAATFMVKEYGDQNIWYSISAYSVAGTIGVFRVMNNRHWISDVLQVRELEYFQPIWPTSLTNTDGKSEKQIIFCTCVAIV